MTNTPYTPEDARRELKDIAEVLYYAVKDRSVSYIKGCQNMLTVTGANISANINDPADYEEVWIEQRRMAALAMKFEKSVEAILETEEESIKLVRLHGANIPVMVDREDDFRYIYSTDYKS